MGIKVVLIKPIPRPDQAKETIKKDPQNCVTRHLKDPKYCANSGIFNVQERNVYENALVLSPETKVLDPNPAICQNYKSNDMDYNAKNSKCFTVIGNVLVYRNSDHLTAQFASTLAPYFNEKIVEWIN
jgi:hypothetical protein